MMKKTIVAILCGLTVFGLVGCGGTESSEKDNKPAIEQQAKDVDVAAIKEKFLAQGYIRGASNIEEEDAKSVYHLDMNDVEEYAIIETMISPGPGFLMMVEAKDGKVDAVKSSVEKVLTDKAAAAFYPEERDIVKSAKVETVGNVVYLSILNGEVSEEANKMLLDSLK